MSDTVIHPQHAYWESQPLEAFVDHKSMSDASMYCHGMRDGLRMNETPGDILSKGWATREAYAMGHEDGVGMMKEWLEKK